MIRHTLASEAFLGGCHYTKQSQYCPLDMRVELGLPANKVDVKYGLMTSKDANLAHCIQFPSAAPTLCDAPVTRLQVLDDYVVGCVLDSQPLQRMTLAFTVTAQSEESLESGGQRGHVWSHTAQVQRKFVSYVYLSNLTACSSPPRKTGMSAFQGWASSIFHITELDVAALTARRGQTFASGLVGFPTSRAPMRSCRIWWVLVIVKRGCHETHAFLHHRGIQMRSLPAETRSEAFFNCGSQ